MTFCFITEWNANVCNEIKAVEFIYHSHLAQNEALKSELKTVSGYLETAQRNVERFKAEAASFRSQLAGKEQSLEDAMMENQRLCQHLNDGDLAERKQHKVDKLAAQVCLLSIFD